MPTDECAMLNAEITSLRQQVETLKKDVSIWKASSEKWAQRHAEAHAQVETLTQERDTARGVATLARAFGQQAELGEVLADAYSDTLKAQLDEARQQLASLAAAQERMTWQPIETAPRANGLFLFCIVPKTADESYHDTSGNPIVGTFKPFLKMCGYGEWSALSKATHWMPLPALPSLAASSRETTEDDTRQSSPSPVRTTGSPRSPQPKGSER